MIEDSGPSCGTDNIKPDPPVDNLSSQRVYKKTSPNNKLTLYLSSRDLIVSDGKVDKLYGILLIDPDFVKERKVYGQITLTFRYGREDEEVMGLKFCNEAIMCLAQLYPPQIGSKLTENVTPLQEALLKRLGPNAYPFAMEITPLAPPSVQLVPAKEYNGAPIGTSYDVRAYIADKIEEKLHRRTTVRMGIRVIQSADFKHTKARLEKDTTSIGNRRNTIEQQIRESDKQIGNKDEEKDLGDLSKRVEKFIDDIHVTFRETGEEQAEEEVEGEKEVTEQTSLKSERRSSSDPAPSTPAPPSGRVEKPFLLSDGRVELSARLDKAIYCHGEEVRVTCRVRNDSNRAIKRIKVLIVQHVDVCMFSNGKFKNVVAAASTKCGPRVLPANSAGELTYALTPTKTSTKNWIALEDSYSKSGSCLASTVVPTPIPGGDPADRNVFAIYVSYYAKIKLILSTIGGSVSLKLPFSLRHNCDNGDSEIAEEKVTKETTSTTTT